MARPPYRLRRAARSTAPVAALACAALLLLPAALPAAPTGDPAFAASPVGPDRVHARFALDGPRGIAIRRKRGFGPLGPTLDVYRRVGDTAPRPAVLVVHGGGWSGGGKGRSAPVAMALARAGIVAVNLGYTLAAPGFAGYPRQPAELRAAVRWIRRNASRLGVDPRRVGVFGSSAGGHLAALLATRGRGSLQTGARVAALATWSAPLDLGPLAGHRLLGPAAAKLLGCPLASCPDRWREASPLTHVTPDDPPSLLFNATREMVPLSQAERMSARLAAAAVPHELRLLAGRAHAREYADRVLGQTVAFLRRELRR
jgi:acetyl esterase